MLQSLVVLLLVSISLVSGFGTLAQVHGPAAFTTRSTSRSSTSTSSLQATASSNNNNNNNNNNNIFQEYTDKPIVLLGRSSEHNELTRLAQSLSKQLGSTVIDHSSSSNNNNNNSNDMTMDDYASCSIGSGNTNILVLDFKMKDYTEIAKALYQDQFLCIYINVFDQNDNHDGQDDEKEDNIFVPNSDYELCIKDEGSSSDTSGDWMHLQWELTRLVARALLPPAIPGATEPSTNTAHLTMGENTFFLSLSFPNIQQVEPFVEQMCADVDAMEYRTDLLDCRDSRFHLIYGQQLLRQYCRPYAKRVPGLPLRHCMLSDNMPIVYTVRTQNQAGTYPDHADGISRMFDMLTWGLRSGAEVLDVESAWDPVRTAQLLDLASTRYSTQILGSHHVVGKQVSLEEAVTLFDQCAFQGQAHGAKVVLSIDDDAQDKMAYQAALISQSLAAEESEPVIPSISLILGDVGQFSRIINLPFTPVTHESLPSKAAPGQLTANEILATRLLTKILFGKKYCILGHNIDYSVSPQMHNAAFEAVRLPHAYARADVETVEEFIESDFFRGAAFGGASVTIPHKQSIMKYVDVLSDAAKTIGSVNTLVVKEELGDDKLERYIYGDNTDWKGIFNPLSRILSSSADGNGYALILGGGGTARAAAYAADKLGLQRLYYNRTPEKAQDLADTFGGRVVSSLEQDADLAGLDIRVVISTLPAAVEFELPAWMLSKTASNKSVVVFDVNYKPYSTKLLEQAEAAGCNVVRGSEMLWEQGVGQFELWTKRTAPYKVMRDVVLENCLPQVVVVADDDEEAFQ